MTPVVTEPLLGYHPCSIGFLTSDHELVGGQCQVGSLTGAVASERVSEALKGSLRMDGNHSKSAKAETFIAPPLTKCKREPRRRCAAFLPHDLS